MRKFERNSSSRSRLVVATISLILGIFSSSAYAFDIEGSKEEKCAALKGWLDWAESKAGSEVLAGRASSNEAMAEALAPAFQKPIFAQFFAKDFLDYSTGEWRRMGRDFQRCRDRRFSIIAPPLTLPHMPRISGLWYQAIFGDDYIAQINAAELARREEQQQAIAESARQQQLAREKAEAERLANPIPEGPKCDNDDVDCIIKDSCKGHIGPHATLANREYYPTCLNQNLQRQAKVRHKTLAAEFEVEGELVRLFLGRHLWNKGELGDWCGETLWGRLEYPAEFRITPALAKTTMEILNSSLSNQCSKAKHVEVHTVRFSNRFSDEMKRRLNRTASGYANYLNAFKDKDGIWRFTLDKQFVQAVEGNERLRAFWKIITNAANPEYALASGYGIAGDAARESARSRLAEYALEGKVCSLPENARHCYVATDWTVGYGGTVARMSIITHTPTRRSSCPEPCAFTEGYCNMETGQVYGGIEAAERTNCRDATESEIDAAIEAIQPDASISAYGYEILYTPWRDLPHGVSDGLRF